jgi:hypothetical protein
MEWIRGFGGSQGAAVDFAVVAARMAEATGRAGTATVTVESALPKLGEFAYGDGDGSLPVYESTGAGPTQQTVEDKHLARERAAMAMRRGPRPKGSKR